jgi:AcrR family transcriptional regulator
MSAQPSTIRTAQNDAKPARRLSTVGRPGPTDGELLDAAAALMQQGGPAAVTMAAVAERVSAPIGSLYHRFPSRGALLGALWLRTMARVQAGVVGALETPAPADACRAAAIHTLHWCQNHQAEAQLLLRGPNGFAEDDWPDATRANLASLRCALELAVHDVADRAGGPHMRGRIWLLILDLPYAIVHRRLSAPASQVPGDDEQLIAAFVDALLPPTAPDAPRAA